MKDLEAKIKEQEDILSKLREQLEERKKQDAKDAEYKKSLTVALDSVKSIVDEKYPDAKEITKIICEPDTFSDIIKVLKDVPLMDFIVKTKINDEPTKTIKAKIPAIDSIIEDFISCF